MLEYTADKVDSDAVPQSSPTLEAKDGFYLKKKVAQIFSGKDSCPKSTAKDLKNSPPWTGDSNTKDVVKHDRSANVGHNDLHCIHEDIKEEKKKLQDNSKDDPTTSMREEKVAAMSATEEDHEDIKYSKNKLKENSRTKDQPSLTQKEPVLEKGNMKSSLGQIESVPLQITSKNAPWDALLSRAGVSKMLDAQTFTKTDVQTSNILEIPVEPESLKNEEDPVVRRRGSLSDHVRGRLRSVHMYKALKLF